MSQLTVAGDKAEEKAKKALEDLQGEYVTHRRFSKGGSSSE